MRKRTERGHDPRNGEHQLGPAAAGYVRDGEHDGRETVKGDHNHDEPGSIKTENSEKVTISWIQGCMYVYQVPDKDHDPADQIPSMPGHSGCPDYL